MVENTVVAEERKLFSILLKIAKKNIFQNIYFPLIVMMRKHGIKSPFCYDI